MPNDPDTYGENISYKSYLRSRKCVSGRWRLNWAAKEVATREAVTCKRRYHGWPVWSMHSSPLRNTQGADDIMPAETS